MSDEPKQGKTLKISTTMISAASDSARELNSPVASLADDAFNIHRDIKVPEDIDSVTAEPQAEAEYRVVDNTALQNFGVTSFVKPKR